MVTVPDATAWTGSAGAGWSMVGSGATVSGFSWDDLAVRIEIEDPSAVLTGGTVAQWSAGDRWGSGKVWGDGDSWLDVTEHYRELMIRSCGRPRWGMQVQPGSATVTLIDPDGRYGQTGQIPKLRNGRRFRVWKIADGTEELRFSGRVMRIDPTELPGQFPAVTVTARSSLPTIVELPAQTVPSDPDGWSLLDSFTERIERILERTGIDPSRYTIEADDGSPDNLAQTDLTDRPWDELTEIALSEGGEFFEMRDETLYYRLSTNIPTDPAVSLATFPDPGGSSSPLPWIPVAAVTRSTDGGELVNRVTVTRRRHEILEPTLPAEITLTVEDRASQASLQRVKAASVGVLWVTFTAGDARLLELGEEILARKALPRERITEIKVVGNADGRNGHLFAETVAVLDVYFGDVIEIREIIDGTDVATLARVHRVTDRIRPGRSSAHPSGRSDLWEVSFTTDTYQEATG